MTPEVWIAIFLYCYPAGNLAAPGCRAKLVECVDTENKDRNSGAAVNVCLRKQLKQDSE